jgi:NDP-sugar pyrophosphorylase family protein
MKAIIIAGGRGERLKPLTDNIPKPMVLVGGKPILQHIINLLRQNGVRDIIIALCYLPEPIMNYFKDGKDFGVNISYVFEDPKMPMGTAGAILSARKYISDTFIVEYADTLRELNIEDMIKFHKASGSIATINAYQHRSINHKSTLYFNEDNTLTKFEERATSQNLEEGFAWSNGAFYIFNPEIFEYISEKTKSDFSHDVFPKLLSLNKKISVFPTTSYIMDIGTIESLEKARKYMDERPV